MNCYVWLTLKRNIIEFSGLVRELNPGPLTPEARIIPLDQRAWSVKNGGMFQIFIYKYTQLRRVTLF